MLVYFDKSVDFCRYSYVYHAKCLMDAIGDFWKLKKEEAKLLSIPKLNNHASIILTSVKSLQLSLEDGIIELVRAWEELKNP